MAQKSSCAASTVAVPPYAVREEQAAKMMGVSAALLRKWRADGGGPRYAKIGGVIMYRVKDVREFVDDSCQKSEATR